jgi:hypothetical protein
MSVPGPGEFGTITLIVCDVNGAAMAKEGSASAAKPLWLN